MICQHTLLFTIVAAYWGLTEGGLSKLRELSKNSCHPCDCGSVVEAAQSYPQAREGLACASSCLLAFKASCASFHSLRCFACSFGDFHASKAKRHHSIFHKFVNQAGCRRRQLPLRLIRFPTWPTRGTDTGGLPGSM